MTFASMRFDMWQAAFQLAVVRRTDRRTDRRRDRRIVSRSFVWLQNVDNSTNEVRLPFSGWSPGQSFAHLFTLTNKFNEGSGKGGEEGERVARV